MNSTKRAIVVFAKEPIVGTVKTRLATTLGAETATRIYSCALADTLEFVEKYQAALPYLAYSPQTERANSFFADFAPHFELVAQTGETLGERLYNALVQVAATNAQQIIVIGTDSPDLPASHLEQAFAALDNPNTDVVLGPTSDGGYYLIGMRQPHRILFERIDWSTPIVAEQTRQRAAEGNLSLVNIAPWYDLDTEEDLFKLNGAAQFSNQRACRTKDFVKNYLLAKKAGFSD